MLIGLTEDDLSHLGIDLEKITKIEILKLKTSSLGVPDLFAKIMKLQEQGVINLAELVFLSYEFGGLTKERLIIHRFETLLTADGFMMAVGMPNSKDNTSNDVGV